jgi:hypothetical protein
MRTVDTEPRDGESLTDWINRVRPEAASEIVGQPVFGLNGLAWTVDGWTVTVEIDEAGQPAAHWHAPDGKAVIGYTLHGNGRYTATVDTKDSNAETKEGWPVAA